MKANVGREKASASRKFEIFCFSSSNAFLTNSENAAIRMEIPLRS
jgi:hypothetical protein